jgi:myo-inositol 2-dehydrogenase/D-chiro-inositol 1-dehydrogenase
MNLLIVGNGEFERAWAIWLLGRSDHRLDAVFPGFGEAMLAGIPVARDLEDALARPRLDAVIVGGPWALRGLALRRAAAEGFAVICLHPPGPDSEAYYQVALCGEETRAVIVPDLPLRLHPGVAAIRKALATSELGAFRSLRLEWPTTAPATDLVRVEFPRAVDVIRSLIGEIEALTATGDPPGDDPQFELVVQLRGGQSRPSEVRVWSGPSQVARLTMQAEGGSLAMEFDPRLERPARLTRHVPPNAASVVDLGAWDAHEAIVSVLRSSIGLASPRELPGPSLHDATRATELAEAAVRSLRRGRTVELHYESITEEATFKSVMTSTGCLLFIGSLLLLPLAMAGPPLGLYWTLLIPYVIPPVLVIFLVMQSLRLATRRRTSAQDASTRQAGS